MDRRDYEILQSDFSNKIKKEKAKPPGYDRMTNREMDAYEKAVLACKSILKQHFTFNNDNGAESVIVEEDGKIFCPTCNGFLSIRNHAKEASASFF